jgi:uncharacterized protein
VPLTFERLGKTVVARWEPLLNEAFPAGVALRDQLESADFADFYFFEDVWLTLCKQIREYPTSPQFQAIAEARDCSLNLEISKDRMQAWLSLTPAYGGRRPQFEELIALLRENKVSFGVLPEVLERVLSATEPIRALIAQGEMPEDGVDARFEALIEEPEHPGLPLLLEDQSVNFHDLQLMTTVESQQALMRRHPPLPGKPGMNLLKRPVPQHKGRDLPFGPCRGAEISAQDSNLLVSSLAGRIRVHSNTVHVEPVFQVGDIGPGTGDIRFPGTVIVNGNILQGYTLDAQGDILVEGTIEAAWIKAEGNLLARQGMVGNRHSRVMVGDALECRFVEHCQILALKSIRISDIVIHSHLRSCQDVMVGMFSGKGQIAGGSVTAAQRIQARIAGSASHTRTLLEVGVDPVLQMQQIRLKKRLDFYRQKLEKVGEALIFARVHKSSGDFFSVLETLREQLLLKVYDLTEQEAKSNTPATVGKIVITDYIYAGVTVRIGGYTRIFERDFSGATLYVDSQKQEIAIGSVRL